MKIWDTKIGNETEVAASMPKWYARTTVVDLARATTEDGYLDLSKASTSYEVGDKLMFIPCKDLDQALIDNAGLIFTVSEVTVSGKYKFAEGSVGSEGVFFIVKFMRNENLEVQEQQALVPITIEMIEEDRKGDHKLRKLGLRQPGWYRWQLIDRGDRPAKVISNLLVSLKSFHSPDGTSGDAGETFQPGVGLAETDGQIVFDGDQGEIKLG